MKLIEFNMGDVISVPGKLKFTLRLMSPRTDDLPLLIPVELKNEEYQPVGNILFHGYWYENVFELVRGISNN